MAIIAPDIGIDLGTSNTLIYVRGKDIVIDEPSILVLERGGKHQVKAIGEDALALMGRTAGDLTAMRPLSDGMIRDFDLAQYMLQYFVRKAIGVSYIGKPRVIVSVPCNLDDVNRKALSEAVRFAAGSRHVFLIEKPFAAYDRHRSPGV